ncbi:30S ribosomal protein S12 methylthiotransferase RimO [candidate division WOR-3 bacterium]|nr:30S ribosomal protein S12 methylthiotransferase RimO [candidate division WOR-3 bacterium]
MANLQRVSVINLGCPKNRVDAEIILAELAQAGFQITGDSDDARIIIVNTCAFLKEAIEESAQVIEAQQERRRRGEIETLLVTGCLPQREPRELVGRFPWVDAFVGLDQIPEIPKLLKENPHPGQVLVSPTPCWNPGREYPRLLSTPSHYAYLRLTEGCSNCCSYCTIPMIRGPLRLRMTDDILNEAGDLVSIGVKELILIAQDTAAHPELSQILAGLEQIEELRWIRLLYAHPAHLEEKIIEQMAESDKVLNYIDMPIQHLADPVLERMNRGVTSERIGNLVAKARSLDLNFALRTTVIVGFPGETDEEFEMLLEGLVRLRFTHLGIFVYSEEEGTDAAEMGNQVTWEVKKERAERLIRLAERMQTEETNRMTGNKHEAVVDFAKEASEDCVTCVGRLWSSAPEIDRVVEIEGSGIEPGRFGEVQITGGKDDRLFARWIESI